MVSFDRDIIRSWRQECLEGYLYEVGGFAKKAFENEDIEINAMVYIPNVGWSMIHECTIWAKHMSTYVTPSSRRMGYGKKMAMELLQAYYEQYKAFDFCYGYFNEVSKVFYNQINELIPDDFWGLKTTR